MSCHPFRTANITKLISASTSHMIAALIFLYHKFTLLASSEMQIALEKFNLVLITLSDMYFEETFATKLYNAFLTD
jgi:hypothetical protein